MNVSETWPALRQPARRWAWCTVFALVLCSILIASAIPARAASEGDAQQTSLPQSPAQTNAIVAQPRAFGYVLGDIVTQRVRLTSNGRDFEPGALPAPGPAGIWLERRAARIERDAQGHRWLVVDYQIMNSPQELTTIRIPAWKLPSRDGRTALSIAEWSISLAPLTPRQSFRRPGLEAMQPDRAASLVSLAPMQRGVAIGSSALIAVVLAWLGWWGWRNWRASASQPFAIALREIRHLDESAPQAWHALHRAFDRTAGQVTRAETLPRLFERAPHLLSLRGPIEQFFAQSYAWFFAGERPAEPISVHALCARLRRIEKRHER